MFAKIIAKVLWFFVLLALQAVFFGRIHLFGYAYIMPYVYFLCLLPINTPKWLVLAAAFLMGLGVDFFAGTYGAATSSLTLVALLWPFFVRVLTPADNQTEDYEPSAVSMGWARYLRLYLLITLLYSFCYHLVEAFSFFAPIHLLTGWLSSSLLTFVFIVLFEMLRSHRQSNG